MKEKKQFGFRTILSGFLDAFNIEKGLIPTLKDLLINPSIVLSYYFEGKTEKYFTPSRFFVTVFAVLSLFAFFEQAPDQLAISKFYTEFFGEEYLYLSEVNFYENILFFFLENKMFLWLLFIIIPNTIIARLIFRKKDYTLAMHLVIQIYSMCFLSILLLLASKLYWAFFGDEINYFNNLLYLLVNPIMPMLYFYHLLKNTFKLGTLNAIVKTLQLFILSAILLIILALAFLFFILIFYGMF